MNNVLLACNNLTKTIGNTRIVDNVSFELRPGEIVALLGDNGAGKTSLIRLLNGNSMPSSGVIRWQNQVVQFAKQDGSAHARALGIQTVYQDLGLIDNLTITENFFLGNELKAKIGPLPILDKASMDAITREQLQMFGMHDITPSTNISELSGGQRQAVEIARAHYFQAQLLILDEPTSALANHQRAQVHAHIQAAKAAGCCVLWICHDISTILSLVDRVLILYHGALIVDCLVLQITEQQVVHYIHHGEVRT